jgi:hypothetical protein
LMDSVSKTSYVCMRSFFVLAVMTISSPFMI